MQSPKSYYFSMDIIRIRPLSAFFLALIAIGIPINLLSNRYYDNGWTIGEWLISYASGFVRRGLPGSAIYGAASLWELSPIYLIWFASLFSYLILAGLLWSLCRTRMSSALMLSPMILLGPIIGNFLIRKDVLALALYGLSLFAINAFKSGRLSIYSILPVNLLSIVAILSHESYGFWGLPSLIVAFALLLAKFNGLRLWGVNLARSCFYLFPSIATFFFCLAHKGSAAVALAIHESWGGLTDLLPSYGAISSQSPTGAIDAIGWTTRQGLGLSYSTLNDFSFLIWVPAAWMLTIYICIQLFVGDGQKHDADIKRILVLFQFLMVAPLFILGWDFGRWIFLWITSSALFYGFSCSCFETEDLNVFRCLWGGGLTSSIAPGFSIDKSSKLSLLFLGIPGCCWSLKGFLLSTPVGFFFNAARKALTLIVS